VQCEGRGGRDFATVLRELIGSCDGKGLGRGLEVEQLIMEKYVGIFL